MMKFVLVALALVASSNALEIAFGSCDSKGVEILSEFDIAKFLGLWYETGRYSNFFESGDCTTANYTLYNFTTVNVVNSERDIDAETTTTIEGYAYRKDASSNNGALLVVFASAPFPASYNVVKTDYDNYALIWSCTDILNLRIEFAWILSRTPALSEESEAAVQAAIEENGLTGTFNEVIQDTEKCKY